MIVAAIPGGAEHQVDPDCQPVESDEYLATITSFNASTHSDAVEQFVADAAGLPGVLSVTVFEGAVDVVQAREDQVSSSAVAALVAEGKDVAFEVVEGCVSVADLETVNARAASLDYDKGGFVTFGYSQHIDRIVVTTNMDPDKVRAQLGISPNLVTVVHAPEATFSRLLGPNSDG